MSKPALDQPAVLSVLPIIYVAWADGELAEHELRSIIGVASGGGMPAAVHEALAAWLDPGAPPSPTELAYMLQLIRDRSEGLSGERRASLVEIGRALAISCGREPSDAELTAIRELEDGLGFEEHAAAAHVLGDPAGPAPELAEARQHWAEELRDVLDGPRRPIRDRVRQLASELGPPALGLSMAEHRQRTLDHLRRLVAANISTLAYPGVTSDAPDLGEFVAAFETLAMGDLSLVVKMGVQFGLFGGSIYHLGSETQRQKLLPRVASGQLLGCFAMTEAGHGSNVMALATTAVYLPETGELEIHTPDEDARKDYIGNAASHGQMATVFAQLEVGGDRFGVHAILVPIRDDHGTPMPGVTIGDNGAKMGLPGVDNGRLWFDKVRVPADNLLSRFAAIEGGEYQSPIASPNRRFFTMLSTLVGGRVAVASAAATAAKVGLASAIRYGEARRQFGPGDEGEVAIMEYLTHQRRLMPRLAESYAVHFAVRHLQERYAAKTEADAREVETLAAGLKAYATWHATDVLQTCREACGGQGYLAENRFADLKADTDVFTTFEGDNTVLLMLVAKSLLSGFKAQFDDSRTWGMLKHVVSRARSEITLKNPFQIRRTSVEHLRDREFQVDAFRYREAELVRTAAMRFVTRIKAGTSGFRAQIEVQDHLRTAAMAHVQRVILECFAEAIDSTKDPELAQVLDDLFDLYALSRMEADMGWYLAEGYMDQAKAKAVRSAVNELCGVVRKSALSLVTAFEIPGNLVAPIAHVPVPPRRP